MPDFDPAADATGLPPQTDQALIELARAGDRSAFGVLWSRHSDAGRRLARAITQQFDADDLVSEAYLKIFSAVTTGGGPTGPFKPYLFVTIRNLAISWSRKRREDNLEAAEALPDPRATDAPILAALDTDLTLRAFRSLPERWQEVLWFTEVDGLTPADVAGKLGMSANSVAALSYRAREGLRQAWIQTHIDSAGRGTGHAWALSQVGKNARAGLSPRNQTKFDAHLAGCPACTVIAAEAVDTSNHFTTVLLPLAIGVTGTAGLGWAAGAAHVGRAASRSLEADGRRAVKPKVVSRRRRAIGAGAGALIIVFIGAGAWAAREVPSVPTRSAESPTLTPRSTDAGAGSSAQRSSKPNPSASAAPSGPKPSPTPTAASPGDSRPDSQSTIDSSRTETDSNTSINGVVVPPRAGADTPALVSITSADVGGGALYPIIAGTAEPGATVRLAARSSTLATVTTDSYGRWRTGSLVIPPGVSRISASTKSTSTTTVVTLRQPVVSTSFAADTLEVRVQGQPGVTYEAKWDGEVAGKAASDGTGRALINSPVRLASGDHIVEVQAREADRDGPTTIVRVSL